MVPAPDPTCEIVWMINDQAVSLRDEIGGLKIVGIGGGGVLTVEVIDDVSQTSVSASILCPPVAPLVVGPLSVGDSDSDDPCPEECKTAKATYLQKAHKAKVAKVHSVRECTKSRHARIAYETALRYLVIAIVLAALCHAVNGDQRICVALDVLVALTLAFKVILSRKYLRQLESFLVYLDACTEANLAMLDAYTYIVEHCPPGCEIDEVEIDCDCDPFK